MVRSKYSGLCRARDAASIRSWCFRSAVACGSGGQQLRVGLGSFQLAAGRPAQRGPVRGLPVPEQQVIRFALHYLALSKPERFGTRPPPPARRLPALSGLQVISGAFLGRASTGLAPYVVQVIALAQRRYDRHPPLLSGSRGHRVDHDHQMVHGCEGEWIMVPGWQEQRSRSERIKINKRDKNHKAKRLLSSAIGTELLPSDLSNLQVPAIESEPPRPDGRPPVAAIPRHVAGSCRASDDSVKSTHRNARIGCSPVDIGPRAAVTTRSSAGLYGPGDPGGAGCRV